MYLKVLFLGSTLTLGGIIGVGSLFLESVKSESQTSYENVSFKKEEPLVDVGEHFEEVFASDETAEIKDSVNVPLQKSLIPEKKRCEIYHIQSSGSLTAKKIEEKDLKVKITDQTLWERIDKDCEVKQRIYVAYRSGWVYEVSDQSKSWKINS